MPKSPDIHFVYPAELSLSARELAGFTLVLLLAQLGANLALPPSAFAGGPLGCRNIASPSVCHPVGSDGFAHTQSGHYASVNGDTCTWENGATSQTCSVAGESGRGALSGVPLPVSPTGVTCEIPFGYGRGGSATLRVGEGNTEGECLKVNGEVMFVPFTPAPRGPAATRDPRPVTQMARQTPDLPNPSIVNKILRQDPTPRPGGGQLIDGDITINGQALPLRWL